MSALDATDRHIIRLLRLNARISNAKLAAEVGLSPSACLRRVDILEREGVIRGYTAITGSAAGGRRSRSSSRSRSTGRRKIFSIASKMRCAVTRKCGSAT